MLRNHIYCRFPVVLNVPESEHFTNRLFRRGEPGPKVVGDKVTVDYGYCGRRQIRRGER